MPILPGRYRDFRREFPEVAEAYDRTVEATAEAGPFDEKTVQLLKLAMAIAAGLEGAAHSHVRRSLEAGASVAELRHVPLLAITTVGFPRAMAGLTWVEDV
ncbi:MAG: hypothetical protein KatS3mg076_0405 [Candidatus Binatia bacterium]|nr:MAG: hypothetical protein KatS3mg076_0405 [Candidatus Binatia bacterium]